MNENKILKNLDSGRQLEETLKAYGDRLSESYDRISWCRLASNFLTYYDDLEKAGGIDGEKTQAEFGIFLELTRQLMDGRADQKAAERLDQLREGMRNRMQALYAYAHILGLYEHILNRWSYRYEDLPEAVDIEALMREIHDYICKDQDPVKMNGRIQDMLSEMPIRMTRSRFLGLVEKACSCYTGTRSDMADYFFEDMYQQAILPNSTTLDPSYTDLWEIAKDMEAIDFGQPDALDETRLRAALDKLQIAGQQLGQAFSYDFQLIEMINDLYILMLNEDRIQADHQVKTLAVRGIGAYMHAADAHDFIGMLDEDVLNILKKLDDAQQKAVGMHLLLEDQLPEAARRYAQEIEAYGLAEHFRCLQLSQILSKVDMTAELDITKPVFMADRDYIREKTDRLVSLYMSDFKQYPMVIRRAVISDALMKLPLAFDRLEDGEELICQNLQNCKDQTELLACVDLMRQSMQSETEWQG